MAIVHGKGGSFSWDSGGGTESTKILSWTLDLVSDFAEVTDMGDTWKTRLAGFMDWTATVECLGDEVAEFTSLGATLTGINFQLSTGNTLRGATGICTNMGHSVDSTDAGKLTYTIQGTGAITAP